MSHSVTLEYSSGCVLKGFLRVRINLNNTSYLGQCVQSYFNLFFPLKKIVSSMCEVTSRQLRRGSDGLGLRPYWKYPKLHAPKWPQIWPQMALYPPDSACGPYPAIKLC